MSKIVLTRSLPGDAAGLLYYQNSRAVPVSIGTNLALEDGVLNATGGGGASDLSDLDDVNIAASFPLSTSDILFYFGDQPGEGWQNVPNATIVSGAVQGWLASLPGFGASKTFKTNAGGDGFEWV